MAHVALPKGKQQIKFIVEEKAWDWSELPFSTSFRIHQETIYTQVCGAHHGRQETTWSQTHRGQRSAGGHRPLRDEGTGPGNFKGALQLSHFMIIFLLCKLYSTENHLLYFSQRRKTTWLCDCDLLCVQILIQMSWLKITVVFFQG